MTAKSLLWFCLAVVQLMVVTVAWGLDLKSWDEQINDKTRFIVLKEFSNDAVLDKETGLVWEKTPSGSSNFRGSPVNCNSRIVGDRMGWRGPTVAELASLIEPDNSSPALPNGHPFEDVKSAKYWSTTTKPDFSMKGLTVNFAGGTGYQIVDSTVKTENHFFWCVRGGHGLIGSDGN